MMIQIYSKQFKQYSDINKFLEQFEDNVLVPFCFEQYPTKEYQYTVRFKSHEQFAQTSLDDYEMF